MNELAVYLKGAIEGIAPEYAKQVISYSALSATVAIIVLTIILVAIWVAFAVAHKKEKRRHLDSQRWLYAGERRAYRLSDGLEMYLYICFGITLAASIFLIIATDLLIQVNVAPMAVVLKSIK